MILIALTLAFIFVQSMLSPKTSSNESNAVGDAVVDVYEDVVGTDTPEKVEKVNSFRLFIDKYVRKLAHFLEYGLLGIETAFLLLFAYGWGKRCLTLPAPMRKVARSLLFPITVAFLDESIQLFSGRGASVIDMWIDIIGYLWFFIPTYIIFIFIGKRKKQSE